MLIIIKWLNQGIFMPKSKNSFIRFSPDSPPQIIGNPATANLLEKQENFDWNSYTDGDGYKKAISENKEDVQEDSE